MYAAVVKFFVVNSKFFGSLFCLLCYSCHCFSISFAFLNLLEHNVCYVKIAVKVVVEFFLYKVSYEFCYGRAVRTNIATTEFCLCLRFKNGFFHLDGDCGNHTISDVRVFERLAEVVLDSS